MQVGVVGAGIQGSVCASILVRKLEIKHVVLIDRNSDRLEVCAEMIQSEKLSVVLADADHIEEIIKALAGCKVCFDLLLPEYAGTVMTASLAVGADYINTAFDHPFWEQIIQGGELYLDAEFKKAGRTAVLGCGNSPGMVNVFVRKYCDRLSSVDSIQIYGAYEKSTSDVLKGWNPGWSRKQAYIDFVTDPCVFRDGCYTMGQPFDGRERFDFYQYGMCEFSLHSHEESYSLPYVIGKGLQSCEFKYEIDPAAALLYSLGFRRDRVLCLDGRDVRPMRVLLKMLEEGRRDDKPMKESEKENLMGYASLVKIRGYDGRYNRETEFVLPPIYSDRKTVLNQFGTLCIDVALPAIIAMDCLSSLKTGISFAEEIDPDKFVRKLNKYITYSELLIYDKQWEKDEVPL